MPFVSQNATRAAAARPLLWIVLALQAVHVGVTCFYANPLVLSNVLQLLCGIAAVCICLSQLPFVAEADGRRCWIAVSVAFGIWSLAQAIFLFLLCSPRPIHLGIRPDDVLWAMFGLPLLLAVNTFFQHPTDRVIWLDRLQNTVFFGVLYVAVFLPSVRLDIGTCFVIQDVALIMSCISRFPTATNEGERRFFLRLGLYLAVYAPMTFLGDVLHDRGVQPGGPIDLVWTLPTTFFSVLALWHAIHPWRLGSGDRFFWAARKMQGFSPALLTMLSIGVSAYIIAKAPLPGTLCMTAAFALFAARTNARELAWFSAHRQLKDTVLQDALTGLGNRILLRNKLAERLALPEANAVLLFADLDRFKSINDSFGHALGDRLLIEIAARLRASSPADSVICRLGGDEFVVLTATQNANAAQAAGDRLRDALDQPFKLGNHQVRCTASIGVVLSQPGESADHLLRTADHAMYRAKQLGRDRVQLFDAALREEMGSRWQMEAALRASVEAGTIQVAFQPIYSMETSGICGFEALARWTHPELGNVPPNEFISLAEETGLILQLGAQVLEAACSQVAAWNRAWGTTLSVSVNVSPRQFADTGLMPRVLAILARTGLAPALLRLEITETALLTNQTAVKQILEQARAHGIRISLDDFGTGFSSLSFLLNLPVDEVKVDRSFVSGMHQDPDREEVVRTVIHLGHSLGKRVVAEGVETELDLAGLTEMGCECVQGYLIGKPLLPEAMEADFPALAARQLRHPPAGEAGGWRKPVTLREGDAWADEALEEHRGLSLQR